MKRSCMHLLLLLSVSTILISGGDLEEMFIEDAMSEEQPGLVTSDKKHQGVLAWILNGNKRNHDNSRVLLEIVPPASDISASVAVASEVPYRRIEEEQKQSCGCWHGLKVSVRNLFKK